ncbi:MAG: OmpA family protein [Bacteroidales bacterium]|jgi:flagellar motor protein MotB|nr:OmpA family protein [Bacteroidales bacterium]
MRLVLLLIVLMASCTVSRNGLSQTVHTSSNKALRLYNEAMTYYDYNNFDRAETVFRQALELDPRFYEVYMMLGEINFRRKNYEEAARNYDAAVKLDSTAYRPVYFNLANAEMLSGNYADALLHFKKYLKQPRISERNKPVAMKNIRNCEFAIEAIRKPVLFNPESIGPGINTDDDEYWPSITADGQTLMFTRQLNSASGKQAGVRSHEDFYVSTFTDEGWGNAVNAGEPLNTPTNEGAQTLSSNGKFMYFTSCERPGGAGSCDIYFSAFSNGKWSMPYNLGSPVNTYWWESTPSVNADGNMLIFSSNRPGGSGGKDLWLSVLTEKGRWSQPVNLGSTVNTPDDEMSPFIHFDGKTLYFASDGHPGMGGFDIYMTRMRDDSTWSDPKNIGFPINSVADETGLVIDASGQRAYFSSKRDAAKGKDIYSFTLDESVRPDPVAYLRGRVVDRVTGSQLKAYYELINLSTKKVTVSNTTDEKGDFLVCLPSGFNYGINVTKEGYLFYSDNFMFEGVHTVLKPLIKKISLSPVRVGEKMNLANVFYEIDSWELKTESVEELNNLAEVITYNSDIVVEIGGHTDSTGTAAHNMTLSEKRALSVVNYLIGKGISPDRLKYRGYGNTAPIGDNVTWEGRRLNRRTEVRIIAARK